MKGYYGDIEQATETNADFRRVLYTGHNLQLVLMSIPPGGEIGAEVHDDRDQFFRFEAGEGEVMVDDNVYAVKADDAVIVPQGAHEHFDGRTTE
jgi:mannose-6-phosphate isomerase-like protein (cupin superfamily)